MSHTTTLTGKTRVRLHQTEDGYLLWFRDGRFRFTATHERELFLEGQV